MSKFVKKIFVVSLVLAFALSLVGCGVNITSIGLPTDVTLIKGDAQQLEINYGTEKEATQEKIEEAAAKLTLIWTSSDDSVATVDANGLVTAVGAGEADITVSIDGANIQSVCHVVVTVPLESVEAPEALELIINGEDSADLDAKMIPEDTTGAKLIYESSDESVATVDENGHVTAVSNGECVITTSAAPLDELDDSVDPEMLVTAEKHTVETKVVVKTAPSEITLENTEGVLTIGGSFTLEATVGPEDVSEDLAELVWTSSDESIATVNETGKIHAEGIGTATITVTASNGVSATYALTVQNVKCSYCGQEGHTSGNCQKKAADEAAAAQRAAEQAAAAAAAGGAGAGGAGGSAGGAGGSSGGGGHSYGEQIPGLGDNHTIIEDGSAPENSGAGVICP